jgi:hypothetical protein
MDVRALIEYKQPEQAGLILPPLTSGMSTEAD